MRPTPLRWFLLVLSVGCVGPGSPVSAQPLSADARPWQVVKHLVQVIGSPDRDVDRSRFRDRLTGEAAAIGPERLMGTWPAYVDVYIDSLILLKPEITAIPADPRAHLPQRFDTTERAVVDITTYVNGANDNYYFFCERDSIWKVESWRQFPNPAERSEIAAMVGHFDNADSIGPEAFRSGIAAGRTLLNDKELIALFNDIRHDASAVAPQLLASTAWHTFLLPAIPFDSLDEYQVLDAAHSPSQKLFFRLNIAALKRLNDFGIGAISRTNGTSAAVAFELSAILDHTVGFLYAESADQLPPISKDAFIMIKPIADGWWIFKRRGFFPRDNIPEITGTAAEVARMNAGTAKERLLVPKRDLP